MLDPEPGDIRLDVQEWGAVQDVHVPDVERNRRGLSTSP
jgi:hypothetical protein